MYTYKTWLAGLMILFLLSGIILAQSSENYSLKKTVLDAGGGTASSASYQVKDAIGQPGLVGTMTSDSYQASAGFFAGSLEVTGIEDMEISEKPKSFQLYQNYPNPFNPETTIQFDVKDPCEVSLVIYDLLGRQLTVLVKDHYNPGAYTVTFNASSVPSGIYIYRIQMGEYQSVQKMILLE